MENVINKTKGKKGKQNTWVIARCQKKGKQYDFLKKFYKRKLPANSFSYIQRIIPA